MRPLQVLCMGLGIYLAANSNIFPATKMLKDAS